MWELSSGESSGWELSWEEEGNCPGGESSGWELSGWELSSGELS